jgi:hypothetical protein
MELDLFFEPLRVLVGIPWQEGGRTLEGADCAGVCLMAHAIIGIPSRDPWHELCDRWKDGERLEAGLPPGWLEVDKDSPVLGDVAVTGKGGHVSAYAGGGWFLTSRKRAGSVLVAARALGRAIESLWRWHP